MTGGCAPKEVSNAPQGFVGRMSMDSLYSFAESDDTKQEVAKAKKEFAKHEAEDAVKRFEDKKRVDRESVEREMREQREKSKAKKEENPMV